VVESVVPADGAVVREAPTEVRLRFSEPILALLNGTTLTDDSGAEVEVRISVDSARTTVTLMIEDDLAEGRFTVDWEVRSDLEESGRGRSTFEFAPNPPSDPLSTSPGDMPETPALDATGFPFPWPSALSRAVGWLLAATAVGVFAFLAAVQAGGLDELRRLVIVLRRLGLLLILAAIGETLVTAMRVGNRVGASLDAGVLVDVLGSATGVGLVLRALGGLILAIGSYEAARPVDPVAEPGFLEPVTDPRSLAPKDAVRLHLVRVPLAIVGSLMLVASIVILASDTGPDRSALTYAAMLGHHLFAALWLGSGVGLLSVCVLRTQKGRSLRRGSVVTAGAQLAGAGLVVAAVSGVALAIARLDRLGDLFSTGVGRTYMTKVVLAMVAIWTLVQLNAQTRGRLSASSGALAVARRVVGGWRMQTVIGILAAFLAAFAAFVLS